MNDDGYDEYQALINELELYPHINTLFVYDEDDNVLMDGIHVISPFIFRYHHDEESAVKKWLIDNIRPFILNKKVWIRIMPEVNYDGKNEQYYGYARIAVCSKEVLE